MPRIRTIKPELFRHYDLWQAEQDSGLPIIRCWCALLTVCDREGRFRWQPRILQLDCAPFDSIDFGQVLTVLEGIGLVRKYEVESKPYGYVPTWSDHQRVNIREAASSLPEPPDAYARTCTHVHARGEKEKEREGEKEVNTPLTPLKGGDVAKPRRRDQLWHEYAWYLEQLHKGAKAADFEQRMHEGKAQFRKVR